MSDFVNSIAQYFMNFLETDFRKRKLPKRSIERSDRSGNLISVDLVRFPTFHKKIISIITDTDPSFSIKVTRNQHKSNFSADAFDVAIKRATQDIGNINNLVHEEYEKKLEELFKLYFEDPDTFIQESVYTLRELLINTFIANSTNLFTSTIMKDKNTDSEDNLAICDNIAEIITSSFESEINDHLKNYLVDKSFQPMSSTLDKILNIDFINLKYIEVFKELKVSDLFTSLHELNSNKKMSENLQLYLYFGRVSFGGRNYPLFFLPIELNEVLESDKPLYKLDFDKILYINKKAIEYIFQESCNDTSAKISTELGERIVYIGEDQSLSQALNSLSDKLLASFKTDGDLNFETQIPTKSANKLVSFDDRISLALFDKADESNLNDYEELLGHLKDNSKIAEIFHKLISGFIEEEPDVIIQDINESWDNETYQDKLVYASPIPLNEEQRKILNAINSSNSKYITVQGPPGTGKSHTIAAILFEAIFKNKSTLMLSDKKEALDVVETKLEEVLNKTRLQDHNSQNPILRLGKQGNTYSKILQTGNINQIREHLKLSGKMLGDDDTESITSKTKETVEKNKEEYLNIDTNNIKTYLISKAKLSLDDVEERAFRTHITEFNELTEKITSIGDFFKNEALINHFKKIGANSTQEIILILSSLAISSSVIEKYGDLKFLSKFYYDSQYLKQKIIEYNNKKQQIFGFFLNKRLESWNNDLNNKLPLKSYIDFRSPKNLTNLQKMIDINYHLEESIRHQSHDLDRNLIEYNILTNEALLSNKDALRYVDIINQITQILSNEDLDLIKTKLDIRGLETSFLNLRIEELTNKINAIANHVKNFDKIQNDFDIEHLSLSSENDKIYEVAAIEMAHNFNKRFVEFVDKNRTKALTLKKIISSKQPFPREDLDLLKNAFPCIIAGIRDYADYIPMEPELFDLIIIDEASQVSIAQAFPAVLRAKKIIILGDKKQFSNVKSANSSNAINNIFQDDIRAKFNERYNNDIGKLERSKIFNIKSSILEFFENVSNFDITLRKHFRGYPEIISFSSKNFYEGTLQAVKVRAKPISDVIEFHKLEHDGKMETSNINTIECKFIITEIEKLLELDEPPSVGVLTPMKDQQKFILSEIEKSQHYHAMQKLNIKIMTFDSCQGEERDVIFYSFVDSPVKSISYSVLGNKFDLSIQDPENNQRIQRLNVGMSRAKEKIVFVLSMDIEEYSGNTQRILNHYMQELELGKKAPDISETESPMEQKLLHWITVSKFYQANKSSLDLIAQFDVGKYLKSLDPTYNHPNYRSDFLLTYKDGNKTKKLILEYDGLFEHFNNIDTVNEYNYESHYSEKDLEREKILESYGFPMLRFNKFNITDDPISEISNRLESFFLQKM